jgi:hypothetical protein
MRDSKLNVNQYQMIKAWLYVFTDGSFTKSKAARILRWPLTIQCIGYESVIVTHCIFVEYFHPHLTAYFPTWQNYSIHKC